MQNNINEITEHIEKADVIIQLIEECAELVQACAKLMRAYRGTTPVPVQQARSNFIEEMADVSVVQAVALYGIMEPKEQEQMFSIEAAKAQRWVDRIEKGELH